jgi:hypothetical protein
VEDHHNKEKVEKDRDGEMCLNLPAYSKMAPEPFTYETVGQRA